MPKLKLKRTPEEEAAKLRRKARKHKSFYHSTHEHTHSNNANDDAQDGPQPYTSSSSKYKPDYDQIRAELEETRFREKLSMAMDDDFEFGSFERIDALESRFNDYTHIPDRFRTRARGSHTSRNVYDDDVDMANECSNLDPSCLDDEEYAEYVRMGMYRKTHAQEYEEKERQKTLKAERRQKEKAQHEELMRIRREDEERRRRRKEEKDGVKWSTAKQLYDERWRVLLAADTTSNAPELSYADIPWPVRSLDANLSEDAISKFILWSMTPIIDKDTRDKERKDRLRETMLRFHPDKFEVRILKRVRDRDKERVKQTMGIVVRTVKKLMAE